MVLRHHFSQTEGENDLKRVRFGKLTSLDRGIFLETVYAPRQAESLVIFRWCATDLRGCLALDDSGEKVAGSLL